MKEKILEAIQSLETEMDQRFENFDSKYGCLDSKLGGLSLQLKENTDTLKALEHSAEVSKADHNKMMNDIAHICGDVEAIKNILKKWKLLQLTTTD